MAFELSPHLHNFLQKQATDEVLACNRVSERFGLSLTAAQAAQLVQTRGEALAKNGRIEFGGGVIDKIIEAFCDSPYLSSRHYAQTLHELIEIFYLYKNETLDLASDDELIKTMKTAFDGACQGSLELLAGRELYYYAQNLRFGRPPSMLPGEGRDEDAPSE